MQVLYTELDCYEDVVEGYVYFTGFQVDFNALIRDGFAEQVEFQAIAVDDETGEEVPCTISVERRTLISETLETLAEDYYHGEV